MEDLASGHLAGALPEALPEAVVPAAETFSDTLQTCRWFGVPAFQSHPTNVSR